MYRMTRAMARLLAAKSSEVKSSKRISATISKTSVTCAVFFNVQIVGSKEINVIIRFARQHL